MTLTIDTRLERCIAIVALAAGLLGPAASARADEPAQAPKATAAPSELAATTGAARPATAPPESTESERDKLSRRATDPTASPLNFGLINDVTTSYRDREDGTPIDENGYPLKFQPVIPFKAWGIANILRMTVPTRCPARVRRGSRT